MAAKKTFEGLRDLSPPAEAGLQDRGMRIQGGRREETRNSLQGDQASRHMKPGVGSILGGKGMCKGGRASVKGRELAASTTKGTVIFRN